MNQLEKLKSRLEAEEEKLVNAVIEDYNKCEMSNDDIAEKHGIGHNKFWKITKGIDREIRDFRSNRLPEKQVAVLDFVRENTNAEELRHVTVSEIVDATQLSKSYVHNILYKFRDKGLVAIIKTKIFALDVEK